jgi:tetratricopeptide (TPR) repeat protein
LEQAFQDSNRQVLEDTKVTPQATVISQRQETGPAPQETKEHKRRWWLWLVAGAAVVLCVFLGVWGLSALNTGDKSGPQSDPALAQQYLQDARLAREEKRYWDAEELYYEAIDASPDLVEAYLECSKVLITLQDMEQAAIVIQLGLDANPDEFILHERSAELAVQDGRWEDALREADWLIDHNPDVPLPYAFAALATIAQYGRCDEQVESDLDRALTLDPGLAWAHYGLAICHVEHEELNAARDELTFILEMEDISPALRARAEQMITKLSPDEEDGIGQAFENLIRLTNGIDRIVLRRELKTMLAQAQSAWDSGNTEEAVDIMQQVKQWIADNREVLEEAIAVELDAESDRLLELMTQL